MMAMARIYTPPDNKTNFLSFPRLSRKAIVRNKTDMAQGLMLSINAETIITGRKPCALVVKQFATGKLDRLFKNELLIGVYLFCSLAPAIHMHHNLYLRQRFYFFIISNHFLGIAMHHQYFRGKIIFFHNF